MTVDEFKNQFLEILKEQDITGRELIRNVIIDNKDKIRDFGYNKYDIENPASMGNFISKEIMPCLGVPVYKEKKIIKGKKQTLYSLKPGDSRTEMK